MTKQEALIDYKHLCDNCREMFDEPNCDGCASSVAIECIEKCIEIGSCKECKAADFCYDNPDVCFCLEHDHIMCADDTCSYFYRDGSDNE